MASRTFAIGDIHGDVKQVYQLFSCLPPLDAEDTIVFLGDYLDRGPASAQVIDFVRRLQADSSGPKVIALRGNHEDAWLRVIERGWDAFVLPTNNGCLAALRSFEGGPVPDEDEKPSPSELERLCNGAFFPPEVVEWLKQLPYFYEDDHAIYVHAGIPRSPDGHWLHPSQVDDPRVLLWLRDEAFFIEYRGKTVVFGHTTTDCLPPEYSSYTPSDPTDLWAGVNVIGIDTGCGKGGFLTAIEFPALHVFESR